MVISCCKSGDCRYHTCCLGDTILPELHAKKEERKEGD